MATSKTDRTCLPKYYTFEVYSEDLTDDFPFDALVRFCQRFTDDFALIAHSAETDDKKDHIHVLAFNDSRREANILKKIPSPVAYRAWQPVRNPCDFARYMLHETDRAKKDGKKPYLREAIVTSSDEWFDNLRASDSLDPHSDDDKVNNALAIFDDAIAFASGAMSLRTFISNHPEAVYKMGQIKTLIELSSTCSFSADEFSTVAQARDNANREVDALQAGIRSLYGSDALPMIRTAGMKALKGE